MHHTLQSLRGTRERGTRERGTRERGTRERGTRERGTRERGTFFRLVSLPLVRRLFMSHSGSPSADVCVVFFSFFGLLAVVFFVSGTLIP